MHREPRFEAGRLDQRGCARPVGPIAANRPARPRAVASGSLPAPGVALACRRADSPGGRRLGNPVDGRCPGRRRLAYRLAGAVVALAAMVSPGPAAAVTGTVPGTVPEASLERRVGHAYRLATGELAYRVVHEPRVDGERLLADHVRYVTPDGELIARKTVQFGGNPLIPAFRLEIVRNSHVTGLERLSPDRIELFSRDGADAETDRTEMTVPSNLVADAGFDILVNRRFDELKAGEVLRFPFAVPSRLRTIQFRAQMVDQREVLGEPAVIVRMEPANAFYRLFVDPLHFAYDAETGALLRYEGPSNLPDPERDGRYRVRIDFPPGDAKPVAPERTASHEDAPPDGR